MDPLFKKKKKRKNFATLLFKRQKLILRSVFLKLILFLQVNQVNKKSVFIPIKLNEWSIDFSICVRHFTFFFLIKQHKNEATENLFQCADANVQ